MGEARPLVTGGHGFVASHLARALLERGDTVAVLDRGSPPVSALALHGIEAEVELIDGDLRDAELVEATIDGGDYDVIFHLAAQTTVGPAEADPTTTFEVNVRGTWILLEACRNADVPAVVVASSDKAYGPSEELPYREDMPLRPASPYEASKAAADVIALSYRPAFGLPVAVTRFANIYGGGDLNFSRLVPEAVTAVLDGRRPVIRSDGSPRARLPPRRRRGRGLPGDRARGRRRRPGGRGGLQRRRRAAPLGRRGAGDDRRAVSGTGIEPEILGTGNPARRDRPPVPRLDQAARADRLGARRSNCATGLARTLEWYREHPEATLGRSQWR